MKTSKKTCIQFFVLFGMLALAGWEASAQSVSFVAPKENPTAKAGATEAKIIIDCPSPNMALTHEMGKETATKKQAENGIYRYELTHPFNEDESEAGFCKTIVKVSLPQGSASIALTMYPGKVYAGSFTPAGITCLDESLDNAVFPVEKKAMVGFSSTYGDLTILCNNVKCFVDGKPVITPQTNKDITCRMSKEGSMNLYELIFNVDDTKAADMVYMNPVFSVKTPKSGMLTINLKKELASKASFKFRVFESVRTVQKEFTFDETLDVAKKFGGGYISESASSYFEAARNAYDAVLEHKDCPVDQRETIRKERDKMAELRKLSFFKEKADTLVVNYESKSGFDDENVFKWLNAERKFCQQLVDKYPEVTVFNGQLVQLTEKLNRHPQSKNAVTTTVTHTYQVISGKVTKDDSFYDTILGTPIYAGQLKAGETIGDIKNLMNKSKEDMALLGKVQGDGSYQVILKVPADYLYFFGERKVHPITPETKTLDVELTRSK